MNRRLYYLIGACLCAFLCVFSSCSSTDEDLPFDTDLIPFEQNDKWGYFNDKGEIVISPSFKAVNYFSEGLAPVQTLDDKWGYIDKKGKFVIAPKFIEATVFVDGKAFVVEENKRPICIDKKGKSLFTIKDSEIVSRFFSNGTAIIVKEIDGDPKCGVIDSKGKILIDCQYENIAPAGDINDKDLDLFAVAKKINDDICWGLMNKKGKVIIPFQYSSSTIFSDGLVGLRDKKNDKWGFYDKDGKVVIAPQFDEVSPFNEGLAAVKIGGKCGYIDKKGKMVINPQYNGAFPPKFGRMVVSNDKDLVGVIDKDGKLVVVNQFRSIQIVDKNLAIVETDDYKYKLFDIEKGMSVNNTEFDELYKLTPKKFIVKFGDSYGMIDEKGEYMVNPQFSNVRSLEFIYKGFYDNRFVKSDYYDANAFVNKLLDNPKYPTYQEGGKTGDEIKNSTFLSEKTFPYYGNMAVYRGDDVFYNGISLESLRYYVKEYPDDRSYYENYGDYGKRPVELIAWSFNLSGKALKHRHQIFKAVLNKLNQKMNCNIPLPKEYEKNSDLKVIGPNKLPSFYIRLNKYSSGEYSSDDYSFVIVFIYDQDYYNLYRMQSQEHISDTNDDSLSATEAVDSVAIDSSASDYDESY